jgi:hypothetical protein
VTKRASSLTTEMSLILATVHCQAIAQVSNETPKSCHG